ncbi:RNA polymerase sigma factor [Ktedonospora formicarum]|uniref:RNA polymerase sigma factor n=1 Tax=Ktedonospora formicarum TaxID=2778364 RepID=A0A8J3I4E1_9CHLR|nr:sigma-70 family RNA polymerase sigma factor [Ktedonospora formicarum]GHO47311.1 DNA-directed RNA polymerase sigma-70 factor [Ktedonospora formicarum]
MNNNPHLLLWEERSPEEAEAQLLEAAKANPADFAPLYFCYEARVYRYLRTRASNDEDADDLLQQVFLNVLEALPAYRARGIPFAAWLFRIARHVAIDHYRRSKRSERWDFLPEEMHASTEQSPEVIALKQEDQVRLRGLLAQLPDQKRELLALRFAAGLSTAEIAQVVGKSHASVKKQITRLLHSLKEQYRYG